MRAVTAIINTKALVHNVQKIKSLVPNSKIVAVVKANAYGHGLFTVAHAIVDHVDAFAVARIDEALALHKEGINKPIVLLEGFFDKDDLPLIAENDLYTAVHDIEQVESIEKANLKKPIKCWMKIDIGMHRLGASPDDIKEIKERLIACKNVVKPLGLISHLSVADTPSESKYNEEQINYFLDVAEDFKDGDLCLANSAGILEWPKSHTAWVRPGIIMYGISPFENKVASDHGLKPVMTLQSSLIAIRKIKKGDRVGYGAAWTAPYDTILGIVATGYGDGYPRTAPNGTPVLVNDRIVTTAGHVCMDMLFVDLGIDSKDKVGDKVILWGEGLPVEHLAKRCGTIPYELVCHIMPRVDVECI